MKYLLTSAGLPPEVSPTLLKILNKPINAVRVCFIPTAADPEEDKWFLEKDKERLSELGFKMTEIDLKQENEDSLRDKLAKFDLIFVEGGNTFYLMKYIKESGFDKVIKEFSDRDIIYIGVSAGSYVAGPDISPAQWKYAEDKNIVGLKDFRGMGLVDFIISPHYRPEHEPIINKNKDNVSCPIIALTDSQAVLVENSNFRFIGSGEFKEFK